MYSEIEQATLDIDWFFTNNSEIAFAASGSGKLSASVAKSREDLELVFSWFEDLPERCDIIINPELKKIVGRVTDMYLLGFVVMAYKGLFAYDKTRPCRFLDFDYHLVASPVNPLRLSELPLEILTILLKTKFEGEMSPLLNTVSIQ